MTLKREARAPGAGAWIRKHAAGLSAAGLGIAGVAVTAIVYFSAGDLGRIPDPRMTTPFLVATLIAGVASLVRREGSYTLAAVGVGLAGAAMVLGWAIVVGAVALGTLVAILILHQVM